MSKINIERLLTVIATYDVREQLYWRNELDDSLTFFVNCNDLFCWGASDVEPILTDSDIDLLEECCELVEFNGPALYAARKRKMRPQGICYAEIPEEDRHYFNDCGPEREVNPGNPCRHDDHNYMGGKNAFGSP